MNSFSFPVHEEQVPGDGGAATAEQITWSMPEHHAGGAGPWGADPPVATVIGSGPLDCSRHSFHGGLPTALAGSHSTRQDWDWATAAAAAADAPPPAHEDASMSTVLYPSHFPADDEDNDSAPDMDCKPSIYAMQVEALGAGAGASSASHRHGAFSYHHPYSHHHHQHAGLAASARHYDDAGADHTPWPAASIASLAAATGYTSSRNYNSGSNNNIGLDICTPLHGVNYSVPSYGGGAAGGGLVVTSGSSHGINVTGLYSSAASYGGTSGLMNNYLGVGEVQARAAAAVSLFEQRASSQYNVSPYLLGLTGDEDHRRIHDLLMRRGSTLYYSNGAASSSAVADFNARIGLNLGGRTYFSTHDDSTLAARFGNMRARFRPNSPGVHVPSCQAEGCRADLSMAKHYHRRHKVCEHHSKASTVVINGQTQRFCQQCSRFHSLSEFDEGKRSCRKRLADHNRRRRKPQSNPPPAASSPTKIVAANTTTSNTNTPAIPADSLAAACEGTSSTAEPHRNPHDETAVAATAPTPPPLPKSFDQVRSKDDTNCEQKPPSGSLLSTMALVPSVSLTLQQDVNRSNPSTDENTDKDDYEPFMQLSGPSLTLSSLGGHRNGQQPVGHGVAGTLPAHSSGFGEVDVSWLRAVGSSTVGSMQENLGRSAAAGSMNSSGHEVSLRESNTNACRSREHHHISSSVVGKSDTWSLEANPSGSSHAASREENTVLSLLEGRPSCNNLYKEQALASTVEERVNNAHDIAAASLGFFRHSQLFDHHTQNSTASCLQVNNEQTTVGDVLSVQRMQELMPLQQQNHESSIYTTANFMKDGFS